jgi:hypothetical protein
MANMELEPSPPSPPERAPAAADDRTTGPPVTGPPPAAPPPTGPDGDTAGPPPTGSDEPAPDPPATVRALGGLLWIQAALYAVGTLVAIVAYVVRGPDHLGLGGYAHLRTHPVPTLVIGVAVTAALVWLARRLPVRRPGPRQYIVYAEVVLILDAVVGLVAGLFSIWSVAGLLAAVAALWYLRADDTAGYMS